MAKFAHFYDFETLLKEQLFCELVQETWSRCELQTGSFDVFQQTEDLSQELLSVITARRFGVPREMIHQFGKSMPEPIKLGVKGFFKSNIHHDVIDLYQRLLNALISGDLSHTATHIWLLAKGQPPGVNDASKLLGHVCRSLISDCERRGVEIRRKKQVTIADIQAHSDLFIQHAVALVVGVGLLTSGYILDVEQRDRVIFEPSEEAKRAMTRWVVFARDGEHDVALDRAESVRAFLRGVRLYDALAQDGDVAPYVQEAGAEAAQPGVVIAVKLINPALVDQLMTGGLGISTIRALTEAIVAADEADVRLRRVEMQALSALGLNVIG